MEGILEKHGFYGCGIAAKSKLNIVAKSFLLKSLCLCLFFSWFSRAQIQTTPIPADFRQHNLLKFNRNLINPAFSFIDSERKQFSFWSRFQWRDLDLPPTSFFVNYTQRIGERNGIGLSAFQHDFDIFTANGVILNYSRIFYLSRESSLTLGINLNPFQRSIDRNNFTEEAFNALPESLREDNFLLNVMPGIHFNIKEFNVGIAAENLFSVNFTNTDADDPIDEIIVMAHASYDYRIDAPQTIFEDAILQFSTYAKTIPNLEDQIGGNVSLSTDIGWIQTGYNSFYGFSFGGGARFYDTFNVGGILELNTSNSRDFGPTFEIFASVQLDQGNRSKPRRRVRFSGPVPKRKKKVETPKVSNETPAPEQEVETITEEEFNALNKEGERYSILKNSDDILPGFYLIVNVYATEKYFNLFMDKLKKDGLDPKYFFNNENKYYYVYLERYDLLKDVQRVKRSKFNGKYDGESWILWVRD